MAEKQPCAGYDRAMALLLSLLTALERQDTLPAQDAIERVFTDGASWPPEQVSALWQTLPPTAQAGLVEWTSQRLDHWHSLKVNALLASWRHDPGAEVEHRQRCENMLRAVLLDLRSGLQRHPELLPDAVVLQQLASSGHAFAWRQAYNELSNDQEGFDLEPTNPDLVLYCQLSTYAFGQLIVEAGE